MALVRISGRKEGEAKVINALCVDVDDLSIAGSDAGLGSRRVSYEVEEETLAVLTELDDLRIKATFFVPGYVAKRSPELVKAIVNAGHDVAAQEPDTVGSANSARPDSGKTFEPSRGALRLWLKFAWTRTRLRCGALYRRAPGPTMS